MVADGGGGLAPAGEGLRYAEYSPPSTKRPDADIDRGLVSSIAGAHLLRLQAPRACPLHPRNPLLAAPSPQCTPYPSNRGDAGAHFPCLLSRPSLGLRSLCSVPGIE